VVRERDFRLVADRIENLSETGMLVTPADPVLTGEAVIVSFYVPSTGQWFDLEATVARVVHGRRPGEFTRGLGLRFEPLEAESRGLLSAALGAYPAVPPGPSARRSLASRSPERLAALCRPAALSANAARP